MYNNIFPYPNIREQQKEAIDFSINALTKDDKKFVIIEAGTGVGKSAIGYTVAKYVDQNRSKPPMEEYENGSYFLTTQKILQDQYVKDFGTRGMFSIKSSSNYTCKHNSENTCAESGRALRTAEKGSRFWCRPEQLLTSLGKSEGTQAQA